MISQRSQWPEYRAGALIPGTQCAAIQKIGQGGQAEVYVVRELYLEKVSAMKLWRSEVFSDQSFREFRAEAIKQAAMKHPNIIEVIGGGMTDESPRRPYFKMNYEDGESLDRIFKRMQASDRLLRDEHLERIRRGESSVYEPKWVTIRDAAETCIQVCAALTHAHVKHGLLHRDVKPANVFIKNVDYDNAMAMLFDFGISKLIEDSLANPDPNFYGTLRYCAPEQLRGQASEQSDLYAVAGMFYELICGAHVFAEAKGMPELMKAVVHQEPVSISKRMSNVSPRLEQLFRKNLHKNPIQRAVSARELGKEIRAIADEYDAAGRAEAISEVLSATTERMAFRSARAMAAGPSEENFNRAKLDSIWDSATGAAVEVGADGVPLAPRIVRGRAVDTDPMNGDEIVAKARAVEAMMAERQKREDAAVVAAQRSEVEIAREKARVWASASEEERAELRRRRARTAPPGPLAATSPEVEHLEERAREESQIRATPRIARPPASTVPETREQTPEERARLEHDRLEREKARAETDKAAKVRANAMAREMIGLPPEGEPQLPRAGAPIAPDAKPPQMGDTDPSRVEPWNAKLDAQAREAVSVKVIGSKAPTSTPPQTERLTAEEQARQDSANELRAHLSRGSAASRGASTTPMVGAPGRVSAAQGKGATVPFGPLVRESDHGRAADAQSAGPKSTAYWAAFVGGALVAIALLTWVLVTAVKRTPPPAHVDMGSAPMVTAQASQPPSPTLDPLVAAEVPIVPSSVASAPASAATPSASVSHGPPKVGPTPGPRVLPSSKPAPKRAPAGESPNVPL